MAATVLACHGLPQNGCESMCHHRGYDYLAERLAERELEAEREATDELSIEEIDEDERERESIVPPADD